jgi:hypothetical protein
VSVRILLTVLAGATFALVTACGGGGDGGNKVASISESNKPAAQQQAGNPADDEKKMKEFAKCMRDHGVDMPDPQNLPSGGSSVTEVKEGDVEKMKAAHEACRPLLPNGGAPPKLDADQLDKLRKQAKCLREHGIKVADPDPNNPEMNMDVTGIDDETLKKAHEACDQGVVIGEGSGSASDGGRK